MAQSKIKLSNERYASLLEAERQLHDLLPEFDKADECGIECQEFRAIHKQAMEQIEALKKHYAPSMR